MSEMTSGERIRIFSDLAKDAVTNPDKAQQAQDFFTGHVMGLPPSQQLGENSTDADRSRVRSSFADALSRTVQVLQGTEFQISVSTQYLLERIPDAGARQVLSDLDRKFQAV